MSKVTNWGALRHAVAALNAEGEHGFEGFVARLFEAETGTRFYVARKGDQPVGDAYSPRAAVALQAKLYDASTLSENEVEGDVDRIIRESPVLDVIVVATTATKGLAQLSARLAEKTQETSLDLLLFSLRDDLTPFGAFCIAHLGVVQQFVSGLDADSQAWATAQLAKADTQQALQAARADLRGLATRKAVSDECQGLLAVRFRGEGAGARTHNRVLLSEAVPRPKIAEKLQQWWGDNTAPVAVLQGDEGMGKTWIAAAFVNDFPKKDTPVVFWLDSVSWAKAVRIEELVDIALPDVILADEPRRARIKRKVFHQWDQPVLLVLDGANECDAWGAAERLLQDYGKHRDKLLSRVRLLFTSRRLDQRFGVRKHFWEGTCAIPVAEFDDLEFRHALAQFAPDVQPEVLTKAVREFAVIPRYFQLCVRLRKKLASLQHLNKEVLLWADLREKLARGDPQIALLGQVLQGSPEEILAHLAESVGWPNGDQRSVTTERLRRSFPDFLKVREDLIEQRIVLGATFDATKLSPAHVVLGWALVLRALAEQHAMEDAEQLSECIGRQLEPAGSNDDKVRAVHVAAVLAFLDEPRSSDVARNVRASLLSFWASHHNARINSEAMQFFVQTDIQAYAQAVENLFRGYLSANLETTLIEPLARIWRDQTGEIPLLQAILERWLRLVYPGDASGSKDRNESPPRHFEHAKTPEQLRLSYASVSVISFHPITEVLSALVDCNRSDDFCYVDIGGNPHQRFPIKSTYEPLGLLLRWSYTEQVLQSLRAIARQLTPGSEEAENLLWFARCLRLVELPKEIGEAQDPFGEFRSSRQKFEEFQQWLRGPRDSPRWPLGFGSLAGLAVRRDLPTLEKAEAQTLCADVKKRVTTEIAVATHPGTMGERELDDLLPWLARYSHQGLEDVYRALWLHVLANPGPPLFYLDMDERMVATDPEGEITRMAMKSAAASPNPTGGELDQLILTELMLLHGSTKQIIEWFRLLEDRVFPRGQFPLILLLPLPMALELLTPPGLAALAKCEFEKAWAQWKANPCEEKHGRIARHWLAIYSYLAPPTKEAGEWGLKFLDEVADDDKLRFSLFRLLIGCTDGEVFRRALLHPSLREYHVGRNAWMWARSFTLKLWPTISFEELSTSTSSTVSGWLLHSAGLKEELSKWGNALAETALCALDVDMSELLPKMDLDFRVDAAGKLDRIGFESLAGGGGSMHSTSSPAWGVERNSMTESPKQADYDSACEAFRADLSKLRTSSRRELMEFNAEEPFLHWSRLEPGEFAKFADRFVTRLREKPAREIMDLSYFASVVAVALLRCDVKRAVDLQEWISGKLNLRVTTFNGAVEWFTRELWSSELNSSSNVPAVRRHLLLNARNDEELLWHAVAAHAGNNDAEIVRLADEYMTAAVAKERALGITLLAFQGDDASLAKLSERRESDASFWIRKHAAWAWEVCALERSCRQRYRDVLEVKTMPELAAGVAELRDAFTPMVWAWHSRLEDDSKIFERDKRLCAYLYLFWHHWGSRSSRRDHIELFGRRLRDHCRGEEIKEGIASRQSPWWQID